MVLAGSFGENKSFGDLGVRQPTGDEFGHYAFTAREYRQRGPDPRKVDTSGVRRLHL